MAHSSQTTMATSSKTEESKVPVSERRVEYQNHLVYSDEHWAVKDCTVGMLASQCLSNITSLDQWRLLDPVHRFRVATLWWNRVVPVLIKVNPTDQRGYRCIVTVTDPQNPRLAFNRVPSPSEQAALSAGLGFMCMLFNSLGLVGQAVIAGNNSHTSLDKGQRMLAGTQKEMSMIHGHVIARGPLGSEAIPGVPWQGPFPGMEFSLREGKIKHTDESAFAVVKFLHHKITTMDATTFSLS